MIDLKYCWANTTELVDIDNYFLRDGKIINKTSGKTMSYCKSHRGDYRCNVSINGKQKKIAVARAILATLVGPPPTPEHTADHIDQNPENNAIENLRWATGSEQSMNQYKPKTQNNAFVIVKDGTERTAKEWAEELGRSNKTILKHAQKKTNGFSYKEYPDLPGELWKIVEGSDNSQGRWEVSNKKRAKYTTKHASIVYDTFGLLNGYPSIRINGKQKLIHIPVFEAFNPGVVIGPGEVVRHLDDDRLNFTPENLAIGTRSQNGKDAHDNGKYDGTKTARKPMASYIDGIKEREFSSIADAIEYLKEIGYPSASGGNISEFSNTPSVRYDRTWKSS